MFKCWSFPGHYESKLTGSMEEIGRPMDLSPLLRNTQHREPVYSIAQRHSFRGKQIRTGELMVGSPSLYPLSHDSSLCWQESLDMLDGCSKIAIISTTTNTGEG